MSPDTQDMEILLDNVRRSGGAQDAPETVIPEFDAFFEKLSTLDNMTLTGDAEQMGNGGAITHKPVRLRPDNPPSGGIRPGQKRKMQVVRSEFIQNSGKEQARRGNAGQTQNSGGNGIPIGLLTFFKLATAAVLLFGIGLGSGYMALSLPFKPVEEGFASFDQAQPGVEAIASSESTGEINTGTIPDVPAFSEKLAVNGGDAAKTKDSRRTRASKRPKIKDETAVVKADEPTSMTANGTTSPAVQNGRKYAIQVGACNSPACVSAYRKLLLAHVSSDAIQVIERNVGNSNATVQRIRVVAPSANDANKLKASLAAADARFKDAYVVALSESPSS